MYTIGQRTASVPEELSGSSEEYVHRVEQMRRERQEELERPDRELVLWSAVSGLGHYLDQKEWKNRSVLRSLLPGTELVFRREPDNAYDRWAVEILTKEERKLGYLPRGQNEAIARMMDHGHRFEVIVEKKGASAEPDGLPISVWMIG